MAHFPWFIRHKKNNNVLWNLIYQPNQEADYSAWTDISLTLKDGLLIFQSAYNSKLLKESE